MRGGVEGETLTQGERGMRSVIIRIVCREDENLDFCKEGGMGIDEYNPNVRPIPIPMCIRCCGSLESFAADWSAREKQEEDKQNNKNCFSS